VSLTALVAVQDHSSSVDGALTFLVGCEDVSQLVHFLPLLRRDDAPHVCCLQKVVLWLKVSLMT